MDNNLVRTEERYRFKSEKGLVIVCVALAVNYNTIYRIPSGVFAHGASYMVAYIILFVIFGYPLSFLDVVLGQYYTRGPYNVFKICPLFEGLGSSIVLWCIVTSVYFAFLMGHGIYLMIEMFYNEPNMVRCKNDTIGQINASVLNHVLSIFNTPYDGARLQDGNIPPSKIRKISMNYTLGLCLLLAWLLIFICLVSEVRRKQRYIKYSTISVILILISILLLYIAKVGFKECFLYIVFDDRSNMTDPKMWILVYEHVLFTLCIGTGVIITFSSYNSFHSKLVKKHVAAFNAISFIVNVFSGIITLTQVGIITNGSINPNSSDALQLLKDFDIPKSAVEIQLLYFNMLNHLPVSQTWMVLVNILLVNAGILGSIIYLEVVFCTMFDNWNFRRSKKFYFLNCFVFFGASLGMCYRNPMYFANALDFYVCGKALLYMEFLVLGLLLWIYGSNRLVDDISFMFHKQLPLFQYLKIAWIVSFFTLLLLIILEWYAFHHKDIIEIVLLLFILSPFIICALYNIYTYCKNKACNLLLQPILSCGPADQFYREMRDSISL